MKDQATHIRLIRDKDGKPVEAEYETLYSQAPVKFAKVAGFEEWAKANRIPVTGDWPDREVFAMSEVEEEKQWLTEDEDTSEDVWVKCEPDFICYPVRYALRLKAKQEPNGQEPWVVNPGGMVLDSDKDGIPIITLEQKEQMKRDGWIFAEEEPKQDDMLNNLRRKTGVAKVFLEKMIADFPGKDFAFYIQYISKHGSKTGAVEPKQEAKTAEHLHFLKVMDQTHCGISTSMDDYIWTGTKSKVTCSTCKEALIKQQYQQEIIETLKARISDTVVDDWRREQERGIEEAIEIIQSTK